eukprot:ANDGO_05490.mRNA.1 Tripeptidyl-peptidase 1
MGFRAPSPLLRVAALLVLALAITCSAAVNRVPVHTATNPETNIASHHAHFGVNSPHVTVASALDWVSVGRADPSAKLQPSTGASVVFSLNLQNMGVVERAVKDVSNPSHPSYGQYWSMEAVDSLVSPSSQDVENVVSFIQTTLGLEDASRIQRIRNGQLVLLNEPTAQEVEMLFAIQMESYQHATQSSMVIVRPASGSRPTLPESVASLVSFVSGFTEFVHLSHLLTSASMKAKQSSSAAASKVGAPRPPFPPQHPPVFHAVPYPMDKFAEGWVFNMVRTVVSGGDLDLELLMPCFNSSGTYIVMSTTPHDPFFYPGVCGNISGLYEPTYFDMEICDTHLQGRNRDHRERDRFPCVTHRFDRFERSVVGEFPIETARMRIFEPFLRPGGTFAARYVNATHESATFNATKHYEHFMTHIPLASDPTALHDYYRMPRNMRMSFPWQLNRDVDREDWENREGVLVAEFAAESYSERDLHEFVRLLGGENPQIHKFGDGNNTEHRHFGIGEGSAHVQTMVALARGLRHSFYSTLNFDYFSGLVIYASLIPTFKPVSYVHTIGVGASELLWHPASMMQLNNYLQQAALMGYTVVAGAGDDGVIDSFFPNHLCNCTNWCVSFPLTSPFVLGVGGSMIVKGGSSLLNLLQESATPDFAPMSISSAYGGQVDSAGGYSMFHMKPEYQWGFGHEYERFFRFRHPTMEHNVHRFNRQVPDLSITAQSYATVLFEGVQWTGGTGNSATVMASMLALMNDRLVKAGKPRVGFVNPFLYESARSFPEAFEDIRVGMNPQTRALGVRCFRSHEAFEGWDPVSGLGSPNFDSLLSILVSGGLQSTAYSFAGSGPGVVGPQGSQGKDCDKAPYAGASVAAIIFALFAMAISGGAIFLAMKNAKKPAATDAAYLRYNEAT